MQISPFFHASQNGACERKAVWIWKTVSMSDHDVWDYASDVWHQAMST
jgi:hypothetical protein